MYQVLWRPRRDWRLLGDPGSFWGLLGNGAGSAGRSLGDQLEMLGELDGAGRLTGCPGGGVRGCLKIQVVNGASLTAQIVVLQGCLETNCSEVALRFRSYCLGAFGGPAGNSFRLLGRPGRCGSAL